MTLFAKDGTGLSGHGAVKEARDAHLSGDQNETERTKLSLPPEKVVQTLNRIMTGWANYFCLSSVSKDYRVIERHPRRRFRQWLCRKHQHKWPAIHRLPDRCIDRQLGLVRLS